MNNLPDIKTYITNDIVDLFNEVQQPRSRFQIEKFVVNAHDTDPMRYVQTLNEIQSLYYTIKTVALELKKTEIEIDRLKATGDEIDAIDAEIKELGLEQTRVVGVGAFRELEILVDILKAFPRYTREDIENDQLEYWQKRLDKQLQLEALGGNQSIASHLNSLEQIGSFSREAQIENMVKKGLE
jgi:formamidopyrimidine-DNA glycosylase